RGGGRGSPCGGGRGGRLRGGRVDPAADRAAPSRSWADSADSPRRGRVTSRSGRTTVARKAREPPGPAASSPQSRVRRSVCMDITITGRGAQIPDRFEDYATEKAEKVATLAERALALEIRVCRHHEK